MCTLSTRKQAFSQSRLHQGARIMAKKGENIFKRKDERLEGRYIKDRRNGKAVYGYVFGKSYMESKTKKAEAM